MSSQTPSVSELPFLKFRDLVIEDKTMTGHVEIVPMKADEEMDGNAFVHWKSGNEKAIRFYQRDGFRFDKTERTKVFGTELRMVLER